MKKLFVPYEIAIKLKEIEFDEPCFSFYNTRNELVRYMNGDKDWCDLNLQVLKNRNIKMPNTVAAPTYDQVIDWFIDKYNIHIYPYPIWNATGHVYSANIYTITQDKVEHHSLGETPLKDLFLPAHFDNRYEALNASFLKAIELVK